MGRKKPKEPESDAVSAQPDIFKTLFGDATSHDDVPSIFSESNPFMRKNQEPGLGSVAPSVESAGNVNHGDSENSGDDGEVKKRKRRKEKKASGLVNEEASETPLEGRKVKKKKLQETPNLENPNLGYELNGVSKTGNGEASNSGERPNMGVETKGGDGMSVVKKMDGKKRKRDELEREYEAKTYGVKESEEVGDKDVGAKVVGEKRKMVDNPADMLVSNEGFDDESKLLRTVFVGNLPLKVKKKVLIKEFSKFGEVESVRIRSVPILDTKKPRKGAILTKQIHDKADSVNGYIVFKTEESAQASLSRNMAVVEGHHIRVDRACPPRKKLKGESAAAYDHTRTVFVGNLPFDVKDEEVYQLFCGINNMESSVEAIRVIRDPNYGIGKGIAYVLFRTREAANLVVKKRNLKLGDRELRLSHAKPDSTPSKRKNPSSGSKANSPAKKLAVGSRTPDFNKVGSKATKSYQGLRAGKPGVQKKFHSKGSRQDTFESRSQSGVKPKERKEKRPSVAARKVKASFKGGPAAKQTGIKRKMDSRQDTFESRSQSGVKPKERKEKRPSVAARKVKASFKGGPAAKQTGIKRKMDSRTPESSQQKKKFKKYR